MTPARIKSLINKITVKAMMPILKAVNVTEDQTICTNLDLHLIIHAKLSEHVGIHSFANKFATMELCDRNMDVEDWPTLPEEVNAILNTVQRTVSSKDLHNANLFASDDENRYILNGVYLHGQGWGAMVATDGRRLFRKDCPIANGLPGSIIIPSKAIKILPNDTDIMIDATPRHVALTWTEKCGTKITLVSKLVEGNYPNYKQVLVSPSNLEELYGHSLDIETTYAEYWHSIGKRAQVGENLKLFVDKMVVAGKEFPLSKPIFSRTSKHITPIKDVAMALNPEYLMDAVKAGFTVMRLKDQLAPVHCQQGDAELIIMPMRLN